MQHRYGRHGPQAWKRRRKRRIGRDLRVLVPSEQAVRVIHIHVHFEARERVIVVQIPRDKYEGDENERDDEIVIDASRFPGGDREFTEPLPLRGDPLGELKHDAELAGRSYARNDYTNLTERDEEDIWAHGENLSSQYISDHSKETWTKGRPYAELEKAYADAFLEGYKGLLAEKKRSELLTTKRIIRIKRLAHLDKIRDRDRKRTLAPYHLDYQAALRAQETLHLDTNNDPDYLIDLTDAVNIYREIYQSDDEGGQGNRSTSSGPFSGDWA